MSTAASTRATAPRTTIASTHSVHRHTLTTSSPLLSLPYELRQQIFHYVFTEPNPCISITASTHAVATKSDPSSTADQTCSHHTTSTTLKSQNISAAIIYANKQLHREVLPILASHVRIVVTTVDYPVARHMYQPQQPDFATLIPPNVLKHVSQVTYLFPQNPAADNALLPRESFPFELFPGLKRFNLRRELAVNMDRLYDAAALGNGNGSLGVGGEDGNERLTRRKYETLSEGEKMECWTKAGLLDGKAMLGILARFGHGGWVSKLVSPEVYGVSRSGKSNDHDSIGRRESGGHESVEHEDGCEMYVHPSGLSVPLGCEVIAEAVIMLFAGQGWRPVHVETLTFEVRVEDRTVSNVRIRRVEDG